MNAQIKWVVGGILGAAAFGALSVMAQPTNFKTMTLDRQTKTGTMSGSTGGSTSLPAIIRNSDRRNYKCLGFGDPNPDHVLTLKQPFSKLQFQVDSGGNDTTLVISGPNDFVLCGDDASSSNRDAAIDDTDWQPGTYQIWVGTVEPNTSYNYRLTVKAN